MESRKNKFSPLWICGRALQTNTHKCKKHLVACLSWHKLTFLRSSEINKKISISFLYCTWNNSSSRSECIWTSLTAGGEAAKSICVERKEETISFLSCRGNLGRENVISQAKKCLREQKLPALFLHRVLRTLINASDQQSNFKCSLEVCSKKTQQADPITTAKLEVFFSRGYLT